MLRFKGFAKKGYCETLVGIIGYTKGTAIKETIEALYKQTEGFDIFEVKGTETSPVLACDKKDIKKALSLFLSHLVGFYFDGSSSQLAKKLGKSHTSITAYTSGQKEPSFSKVIEILDELGFDLEITLKTKK